MKNSFVLKGDLCFTPAPGTLTTLPDGYLVCVDGVCKGAFAELPAEYASLPLTDYGNRLIIPGLIDLHLHAPQFSYRGLCMDLELMDWLTQYTFPEEAKYRSLDYAAAGYSILVNALHRGATTRACIFATRHRPATELLMELMEASGLVSYVGKLNMDRGAPDDLREESPDAAEMETVEWIRAVSGRFRHTFPMLTPRFLPSCTDELMERLQRIQTEYDLPVQSHLSESRAEIELVHQLRPQNRFYGQAYDDYGLFGKNHTTGRPVPTIMAHCIWSCEEELALMQEQGVFIAHCPTSNTNVCSGVAPIRRYLDRGMRIGLGSDVSGSHTDSLFYAITDAIRVSKLNWRMIDPQAKPLLFSDAFYLASKGGGAFFGKAGSFEDGFEFDAVVLDDSSLPTPLQLTLPQRLERAVYLSLDQQGICAKYVQGRQLF